MIPLKALEVAAEVMVRYSIPGIWVHYYEKEVFLRTTHIEAYAWSEVAKQYYYQTLEVSLDLLDYTTDAVILIHSAFYGSKKEAEEEWLKNQNSNRCPETN